MPLDIWTIYERPRDYPQGYVARRWECDRPTADTLTGATLDEVRAQLPPGLFKMPAQPGDDPVIVETWF